MASSSNPWKSRRRQRERIVGNSLPGAWLTRKNKVLAGGSSSILRSALAPDASRSSTLSITATRHGDRAAVIDMNSPSSRTWATLMLRDRLPVFSFTSRSSQRMSGWLPAFTSFTIGCSSSVSMPGDSNGGPAASERTRRAAACAKLAFPMPLGPAISQA
jgi:hypothetical protein